MTPRARRALELALLLGFLLAAAAYYVFVISAGHFTAWPTWSTNYDAQAEGFRAGHLYTNVPPKPEMLKLAEPLNPANMRYWRWDYSYRNGHIYMYWGQVPAALLAAAKVVLRARAPVGDDVLVFVFLIGRLLAGTLLVRAMARRFAPAPPAWAVGLAMAVLALANPTPYMLARGGVYEAAIAGGACFMMVGLLGCFEAVFAHDERAAAGWLIAGSAAFGLAGGSRATLYPAGAAILALAAAARWRDDGAHGWNLRALARPLTCAVAPFTVLTGIHLVLNYLRYGRFAEFGQGFQMGKGFAMGWRFVIPNLWSYLIRPATLGCHFPFLTSLWHEKDHVPLRTHLPSWLPFPSNYHGGEPNAGVLLLAPFILLALGLLVPRRLRRDGGDPGSRRRWRWAYATFGTATVAGAAPALAALASTMRYEADFASGLLLLASAGGWTLLGAAATRPARAAAASLFVALAAVTIVAGVLLGFTSYFDHFSRHNPALMARLTQRLSLCGKP
jgi:hypothetical protein